VENQRGALTLLGGNLYVPYGGLSYDCGNYYGWLLRVPLANPSATSAYAPAALKGGIWAVGGVTSDGDSIFVATGNTYGASVWSGGEAVLRFDANTALGKTPADYFAPSNWPYLDANDLDLGASNPVILDVPNASPSHLIFQAGKTTTAYLLDPANLGGLGDPLVSQDGIIAGSAATAPVAYTTASGTYVVVNAPCPNGGDLTAFKVGWTSPPTLALAWCATQNGSGAPIGSTSDGGKRVIVWGVGTSGASTGDQRLHAFDGDTGAPLFAGGGPNDVMAVVNRFVSPIVANGAVYVGAAGQLNRFAPQPP
jgi:hypothetical protein